MRGHNIFVEGRESLCRGKDLIGGISEESEFAY
jgi:hypothetical protein